ncbi:uncharacterized protein [Diadema antillarum]|uniref:uncharacterized protein n=1 Tax=Diadema antillarum TaxID=105358 RepID=UPI003A8420B6
MRVRHANQPFQLLLYFTVCVTTWPFIDALFVKRIQLEHETKINITSLNYPSHYPNNEDYAWHVTAPAGFRIFAKLGSFSLERNKDFLKFGDAHGRQLIELTGKYSPPTILSPANVMWINFTSDSSSADTGFRFELSTSNHTGVRLVGGTTPFSGTVEVLSPVYGWGTVSDGEWNYKDAATVCKEIGFPGAIAEVRNAHFGAGSGRILMTDVDCSNDLFCIQDCASEPMCPGCSHAQDAGVVCHGPNYLGCLYLPEITGSFTSSSTVENCLTKCEHASMQYAILNGNRCYCRRTITFPEIVEDDESCSRVCSGELSDSCNSVSESSFFTVYDTEFAACHDPGTPHNASRTGHGFMLGSEVTFNCSHGFDLIGHWKIHCVVGDNIQEPVWDHGTPFCLDNMIIIIAAVVASFFGLLFIILLVCCICRCWSRGRCRRKRKKMEMWY